MGTRGALGFACNQTLKVTYNHYDSYPDGLGNEVVEFCNKVKADKGWDKLKEKVSALQLVKDNQKPTASQKKAYAEFTNMGVGDQSDDDWYCLLRNAQGVEGLNAVYDGKVHHMIDSKEFVKDSLFCEYAYVIDLDKMTFDVFRGFQKTAQKGNPFGEKPNKDEYSTGEYYPCRLLKSYPLDKIPKDWSKIYDEYEEWAEKQTA
jgi:hypothetical protein